MAPLVEIAPQPAEDHVIACAAALFLEQGIASVKMTDIARAAGVGVATLYRHYATKTRIAVEAGTLMWRRFNAQIHELVESSGFLTLNGADRLSTLLSEYVSAYGEHQDFVMFLDEFDHLVVSEQVSGEAIDGYGREVDSFYLIFADAYELGRQDGSIVRDVDFPVFYRAVAHALMGVAEKFARGDIIPSDSITNGTAEMRCLVDMAIRSLVVKNE